MEDTKKHGGIPSTDMNESYSCPTSYYAIDFEAVIFESPITGCNDNSQGEENEHAKQTDH